jgi:hypothetical protein
VIFNRVIKYLIPILPAKTIWMEGKMVTGIFSLIVATDGVVNDEKNGSSVLSTGLR